MDVLNTTTANLLMSEKTAKEECLLPFLFVSFVMLYGKTLWILKMYGIIY